MTKACLKAFARTFRNVSFDLTVATCGVHQGKEVLLFYPKGPDWQTATGGSDDQFLASLEHLGPSSLPSGTTYETWSYEVWSPRYMKWHTACVAILP